MAIKLFCSVTAHEKKVQNPETSYRKGEPNCALSELTKKKIWCDMKTE